MAELKIGFRAQLFKGTEPKGTYPVRETYEEAVKDIEHEHDKVEKYPSVTPFTHAQVEKVYFRH